MFITQSGSCFCFPLALAFYPFCGVGWDVFSFQQQVAESEAATGLEDALFPTL